MLDTMDIFKHLPAGKRIDGANCKDCGCATCMMFAMKLAKGQTEIEKCTKAPLDLVERVKNAQKIQQKEVILHGVKIGGETVMCRHEKTFNNPCPIFISLDVEDKEKLKRITDFKIQSVGVDFRVDGVLLNREDDKVRNILELEEIPVILADDIKNFQEVRENNIVKMVEDLTYIRKKAILERDEKYSEPAYIHIKEKNPLKLCAIMSAGVCKYASLIITDTFDEAVMTTVITLRQNIYTDPEKPLQVESKVYEFNNPDENALVFLTTNFALTYFAVANELSALKRSSYLVITPSEGMSVLTAWSAEKITSDIASRVVEANSVLDKVKDKKLILPGLLSDLKDELQEKMPNWEIVVGCIEAYKIGDFVNSLN